MEPQRFFMKQKCHSIWEWRNALLLVNFKRRHMKSVIILLILLNYRLDIENEKKNPLCVMIMSRYIRNWQIFWYWSYYFEQQNFKAYTTTTYTLHMWYYWKKYLYTWFHDNALFFGCISFVGKRVSKHW